MMFSQLNILQAAPEPGERGGRREEHGLRASARPRAVLFEKGNIPVVFPVLQPGEAGAGHRASPHLRLMQVPTGVFLHRARVSADVSPEANES